MEKQLTIFNAFKALADSKKVSPTNTVGDTKNLALQRFLAKVKVLKKQLTIFDALKALADSKKVSPTNTVGDTKNLALQRYLDRAKVEKKAHNKAKVKTYQPNGRKTEYFRLDYRVGKKVKSIHIPGGNIRAKLAQNRAKELQTMINCGAEVEELIAAVQTYHGV